MKLSITSILISSASIAIVSAGTNKTLAPTPGIVRPTTPAPITPFPTELPPVVSFVFVVAYVIFIYCIGHRMSASVYSVVPT